MRNTKIQFVQKLYSFKSTLYCIMVRLDFSKISNVSKYPYQILLLILKFFYN